MSTRIDASSRPVRRGALAASLLALVWALAGCSSGASDSAGGAEELGYTGRDEAAAGADASGEESREGADVIVSGWMYMTVAEPISAADRAVEIVEGAGGRVDARSEAAATEYSGGSATLTLRIPSSSFDPVIDRLRELGTVDEFSTDSTNVSQQLTDLEAEISTLRASTTRIEALIADASDIKDIITLEDELDSRQARLESLEAQQRGLDDQVALATIDLSLTTEPAVPVDDAPRTFVSGLESGWNALVGFVSGALVVTGVLLPWLVVAALVATVAVAVVRARRARVAQPAVASSPEAAATAPTPPPGD